MLPHWLIHPIRAFREDLATNPLTRLTWGIEPRSWKRKRRAWAWTILILTYEGYLIWSMASRESSESVFVHVGSSIGGAHIQFPFLILMLSLLSPKTRVLSKNQPDQLYIAGISSRGMLWGVWAPVILAFFLRFLVELVLIVTSFSMSIDVSDDFFFVTIFALAFFCSLAWASFAVAVSIAPLHILCRSILQAWGLALCLYLMAVVPLIAASMSLLFWGSWQLSIGPTEPNSPRFGLPEAIAMSVCIGVSALVLFILSRLWRRAIRKLEAG